MSDIKVKFEELLEKQRQAKREFQVVAQDMLKETFKEFWKLNPGIKVVRWTQYTPYFNDGDACVFGVNDVYFSNAEGDDMDDLSYYGEYEGENEDIFSGSSYEFVSERDYYKEIQAKAAAGGVDTQSIQELSNLIGSDEMEDILLMMFDDHVVVTATRNGFDVEEYNHD